MKLSWQKSNGGLPSGIALHESQRLKEDGADHDSLTWGCHWSKVPGWLAPLLNCYTG
jgi:hypothetical protein